ncbi:VIT domain-containing protein [Roseimicrobium sp. ORNL1]|uniref:VIT domain-containing protein n=1 Tax=Roseimicrobium sp. ORNL1 TaxID=2711231 RepID=UPI0013E16065|nr:VIT domain-containing protein [Roseimicrobium sp. ORNL1]QIF00188.1 DUF2135 domain-containing protein [Roseimicrobium sp. ORNL1]
MKTKTLFRAALAALLLLSAADSVCGQSNRGLTIRPPQSSPPLREDRRPPVLWINPELGKFKPMKVQSVDVDIKVRGHLATTTMEMTFFNPNGRVLEGELIFPLGEGQTISGYALEVEGKLRQAVVVEKEKGREIFEEIVRRGVDPGLAELTKGNVFRTRVYPIPANGTKRLSVTFEQELADGEKGFRYLLPLAFSEKVGKFHARVEVVKQETAPMPEAEQTEGLTFEKWRDSFVAELTTENVAHEKPLAFIVPKMAERPQVFLVSDKLEPAQMFFHARVEPEVPPAPAMQQPDRIVLYYDASGSAEKRDRKREFAFLKEWMKALGHVTVEVIAFRNDADKPVTVEVKDGDASTLIGLLENLPVDGGTSLGAVQSGGAPLTVLMSDGFSNFGDAEPKVPLKDGAGLPLVVIHAAPMADSARLESIARRTGGHVVNLLTTSTEDALAAMRQSPFQFLSAKVISGKVTDLAPGLPETVTRGFSIAGRCEGKGEIELAFGYAGKVMATRRVTLNPDDALEAERGDFVRRAWAQRKIAELALDPQANESAITALGKEHRIVTAGTSLLVLERMEDYVRHRIQPPEADLQEKYAAMLKSQPKGGATRDESQHLDEVAKRWSDFKEWHGKRHPWLESVLKPTAEREAALYTALAGANTSKNNSQRGTLSPEDAAAARALADKASDLASRWQKEGRNEDTRAAWIEEASNVLLAVDVLRQRRLELMPQSEPPQADNGRPGSGTGSGGGLGAGGVPMAPAAAAAQPMPVLAPAPASPAEGTPRRSGAGYMLDSAGSSFSGGGVRVADAEGRSSTMSGSIEVKAWDPDTPYLKKIRKAEDAYAAYLKERKDNAGSSAFYLDCADYFREEKKDDRLALRVLSNLAEMELENAPLLRILAYRLQQLGRYDLAVPLFEEVLKTRGEEPQSRRDLALCLSRRENPDLARAATLLWEVVKRKWDGRFQGIDVIVLHELNDLLQRAPKEGPKDLRPDVEAIGIQKRFLDDVPVDLRVALTWDADSTDIDLWVIDPTGEVCIYNHNQTRTGGAMSNDFTGGYGPEVFTIRRALPGTYTVKVNYYGNRQQKLAGATTVQVEFQTSFDRAGTKYQSVTRRLKDNKEVIEVGKFVFKPELEAE